MIAAMDGKIQSSDSIMKGIKNILLNKVPIAWERKAYPSLQSLSSWILDLGRRAAQLDSWAQDLSVPRVTWLPGLFEPRAFLAAIAQSAAHTNEWRLEEVTVAVEVTRKSPEDVSIQARDGAYIHGLFLDGASWDKATSSLEDMKGQLSIIQMPVLLIKAVHLSSKEEQDAYCCPVYRTQYRGVANAIFVAELPSLRHPATRWALAGVALLGEVADSHP